MKSVVLNMACFSYSLCLILSILCAQCTHNKTAGANFSSYFISNRKEMKTKNEKKKQQIGFAGFTIALLVVCARRIPIKRYFVSK